MIIVVLLAVSLNLGFRDLGFRACFYLLRLRSIAVIFEMRELFANFSSFAVEFGSFFFPILSRFDTFYLD